MRAGDSAAYGELWTRHSAAGLRAARSITSKIEAEELVAESFTRILAAVRRGNGPTDAFRPYLYTVIRNVAATWGSPVSTTPLSPDFDAPDTTSTDDPAIDALDRGLVADAFRTLPERWQAVLWYTAVEEMEPQDVAPLLGISANSVAALAYRARAGLRKSWLTAHMDRNPRSDLCRWALKQMQNAQRGTLPSSKAVKLNIHLESCESCARDYREMTVLVSQLGAALLPTILGVAAAAHFLGFGSVAQMLTGTAPTTSMAAGMGSSSAHASGTSSSGAGGSTAGGAFGAGTISAIAASAAVLLAVGITATGAWPSRNSQPAAGTTIAATASATAAPADPTAPTTVAPAPTVTPSPSTTPTASKPAHSSTDAKPEKTTPKPAVSAAPATKPTAATRTRVDQGAAISSGTAPEATPAPRPTPDTSPEVDPGTDPTPEPVPDTAAPSAPTVTIDATQDGITPASLRGSGEPGATITVMFKDRTIATATVDKNGNWSTAALSAVPPLVQAGQLTVTQRDKAGNESAPWTSSASYSTPTIAQISISGSEVVLNFKGRPGTTWRASSTTAQLAELSTTGTFDDSGAATIRIPRTLILPTVTYTFALSYVVDGFEGPTVSGSFIHR